MKKFYILSAFLFLSFAGNSQIVNIPDAELKMALLNITASNEQASNDTPIENSFNETWQVTTYNSIDTNGDGEIQVTEAQAIKYLRLGFLPIFDATGLEAFTNLEYLNFSDNYFLNSLNLSSLTKLKFLKCSSNDGLNSLNVTGLTNLKTFFCDNDLNTLNITTLTSLEKLYCYSNNLTSLNASQNLNLKLLYCTGNQLSSININGLSNLETLYCEYNQFTNLNTSGAVNLKKLQCNNNQLTNLNVGQNLFLENLVCNSNQLTTLTVAGLTNLISLNCSNNLITNLNLNGATNLEIVTCVVNQLTTVDFSSNTNLLVISCQNNQLISLNISGLNSLDSISCGQNFLTSLDVSQNPNLALLDCNNNLLTNLDISQNPLLIILDSRFNQLTTLDIAQNPVLVNITIDNNLLQSLFLKNGGYNINNPDLSLNFDNNPTIEYICADQERVQQIQASVNFYGYSATCTVNSYCSFNPGGTFYTVNGNSKLDSNNNGCDTNDSNYPNLKFSISDGTSTGTIINNASGNYAIPVSAGTHTFAPQLENPNYFTVSPTNTTVSFPETASPFTQNFCITPNGIFNDLEVTIIPVNVAVPGFDANYKILYKNKGNQIENASLSFSYSDSVLDYVSSLTTPTSQNSGNLNWNIGTLQPFQTGEILVTLNLNSPMETPALNSGDLLNFTATISGLNSDVSPLDNIFALNQIVVNSFDPNDKRCLEGNTINPTMIGNYIHYMIRFENTGTFNAQNVVVKDDIDLAKFDLSSLQMIQSSHPCITRINNTNKVEFIFENINLPFDDANNDGYVVFKIKTLPSLTVGSQVTNNASIYFDYNFPIITNTETSTFQTLKNESFTSNSNFTIYPNPAKNKLHITSKNLENISSVTVYNILGQIILTSINPSETIDVSNLKIGNYLIKINSENKTSNLKFIKE